MYVHECVALNENIDYHKFSSKRLSYIKKLVIDFED